MTGTDAADYLAELRREIAAIGASQADEVVAEIASLLREAAEEGPDGVTRMLEELGPARRLAARYLSERGLGPERGLPPAEWWRLGTAAVVDAVVGLAVPLAAALPLYLVSTIGGPASGPLLSVLWVLFAGALVWPWYVWRPWRVEGSQPSAGMALAGISVVRLAGVRRILRTDELDRLGIGTGRRSVVSGLVTAVIAVALVLATARFAVGAGIVPPDPRSLAALAGADDIQRTAVATTVRGLYSTAARGDASAALALAEGDGRADVRRLLSRCASTPPVAFDLTSVRQVSPGVWVARVAVTNAGSSTAAGSDDITVSEKVVVEPDGLEASWAVTAIRGPGLDAP